MDEGDEAIRQAIDQHFPGGFTLRDEANAIVACAFRNGPIEDQHAGEPSALLERPELSRITDAEIKAIMLNACQVMERLLRQKQDDPAAYYRQILDFNLRYCRKWEE